MTTYSIAVNNWFDAEVLAGVSLIMEDGLHTWEKYQGPSAFALNSICIELLPIGEDDTGRYLSGLLNDDKEGWSKNIRVLRRLADAIEAGLSDG